MLSLPQEIDILEEALINDKKLFNIINLENLKGEHNG